MTHTLWGSAHSLYTGKARSYLVKKGLPYRERFPSNPDFAARILPAIGQSSVPVLETEQGEIVQDSGDIIDLLESRHPTPVVDPVAPVQKLVSLLFDAFGSEYLLPAAMHYRWSYREQQEAFLRAEFGRAIVANKTRDERRDTAAKVMAFFNGFLPNLGVFPETIPAIESAYLDLMEALDEHFQWHPYLLGGRPSRGDFGMMAPLFAHLGRDPVPAGIMKAKAPNLFRWTERMNSTPISDGEYPGYAETYAADDAIPETLEAVMCVAFADWLPGLIADADCFNAWAADKEEGAIVSRTGDRQVHPNVGKVEFDWRGVTYRRGSQPHMLWMLAAAQAHYAGMNVEAKARADTVLGRTGGSDIVRLKLDRRMKRQSNILVLSD
ncbi:MAG: glutathione S-transferase family protein [Sphingomonadales bacterium]|jgi:glutathione S-transferase|uniref:glutathione S-transferase family protein n=2 Tax=Sphingorhabdus sp. TaxID=1902408 RepID=UPI003BAECAD5|nr:glutathione S-transferase family protein [Sphingomonadales bacterium]MBK9432345.1 glutathione S-transferase family protein [Sphingomonadales bacterium]MBL0022121.1 glutathione S-transferase family protein [Sphingomonadales bacterium]